MEEPDLSTGIYQPTAQMPGTAPAQPSMPPVQPVNASIHQPPAQAPAFTPAQSSQPAPVTQPPVSQPPVNPYNGQKTTYKKDSNYYKAVGGAKQSANKAISELDFNNVGNAIKYLEEAANKLRSLH